METVYDWLTVALFSALIVLFLHRSVGPAEVSDNPVHYVVPALSCAVANYLGNEGQHAAAILVIATGLTYAAYFLKVWPGHGGSDSR